MLAPLTVEKEPRRHWSGRNGVGAVPWQKAPWYWALKNEFARWRDGMPNRGKGWEVCKGLDLHVESWDMSQGEARQSQSEKDLQKRGLFP